MRVVLYILGFLASCLGLAMLPALLIALHDRGPDRWALGVSMSLCLALGGVTLSLCRGERRSLDLRQAFAVVTGGWLLASALGGLPYALSGALASGWDCLFESVSGFTTTGSTVFADVEALPRGLLFWRSLTHWLGGMGIIVLSVAILPLLGVGGLQLFKAEVPGAILPDKLAPRVAETARALWRVYITLTLAQACLLLVGGMDGFEALCHAFGTVATGGFSTRNASVAAFQSPLIEWTITAFMFLAGANFFLHFHALRGSLGGYRSDPEFRLYALLTAAGVGLITLDLWRSEVAGGVRAAAFQVCSILTSTGFATADYEGWPALSRVALVFFMVVGGCAGSTAGGIKCLRLWILVKLGFKELQQLLHPRAILPIRVGRRRVPEEAVTSVVGFLTWYSALVVLSSLALLGLGLDAETALTATLACISNVGPGLGQVGPMDNFGWMPSSAKALLTGCMLLGRLEIYTVLVLFLPDFWRR